MAGEAILVVEDESVVALNVSHILSTLGYTPVGPIATGSGALTLLESERVDLVLMDIKLRGKMDGIELAQRIQALRPLPIVFLTAYTDDQTLSRAKTTEPFGYITKAFDDAELHSTIEMALYKFQMEQKLVRNERLLATTLGNISEGIITTDAEGCVQYMNPAASRLLGIVTDEASGRELEGLVQLQDAKMRAVSPFDSAAGERDGRRSMEPRELTVRRRDGTSLPVEWSATRTSAHENQDAETIHLVRDLSNRNRAEAAQRRLLSLVEFSDDAIVTVSRDATIQSWNAGAEKIFGYPVAEAVGSRLKIISPHFAPVALAELIREAGDGVDVEPFETVCSRSDGTTVDVAVKLQGVRDFAGAIVAVSMIARDVTARKNLDKKVRAILNREQTRIGQDLHDSIGQMITGILFKAKAIEHSLRTEAQTGPADEISDLGELLTATLLKLRELARGLIPATIISDGLVYALKRLAQDAEAMYGLQVFFRADPDTELSDELVSSEMFHIVEEALNNAIKHSLCQSVEISVTRDGDEIVVAVRDDGAGLPKRVAQSGLGLKIMRHRAEWIGASFSVAGNGKGTSVICRLPVSQAR